MEWNTTEIVKFAPNNIIRINICRNKVMFAMCAEHSFQYLTILLKYIEDVRMLNYDSLFEKQMQMIFIWCNIWISQQKSIYSIQFVMKNHNFNNTFINKMALIFNKILARVAHSKVNFLRIIQVIESFFHLFISIHKTILFILDMLSPAFFPCIILQCNETILTDHASFSI